MKTSDNNPFNPQFGKRPIWFVGRDTIVNGFKESLANPNDPNRNAILTGIRGSGKTALLSDICGSLSGGKALVADVTAGDGMLRAILDEFERNGKNWIGKSLSSLGGISLSAAGFSVGVSKRNESAHGFRFLASGVLKKLRGKSMTTVFLIDEVHNGTAEMREFATAYQHFVRDGFDVALMMAGLPNAVNDILNDKVLTFLRRARRIELANVSVSEVETAYELAFGRAGRKTIPGALATAAAATEGYPYLMQLVGYYLWKIGGDEIGARDVDGAVKFAKVDLFRNIHELIFKKLSDKDRAFVRVMGSIAGMGKKIEGTGNVVCSEVPFGEIRRNMKVSAGYASKYRERLMNAGVIHASSFGKLAFSMPYMLEFLSKGGQHEV